MIKICKEIKMLKQFSKLYYVYTFFALLISNTILYFVLQNTVAYLSIF